jgi:hypothetical protein
VYICVYVYMYAGVRYTHTHIYEKPLVNI